jgi:hypothetical protein
MESGKIVEFDQPFKLLTKNDDDLNITNFNGEFARMVLKSSCSEKIFELSKNSYAQAKYYKKN